MTDLQLLLENWAFWVIAWAVFAPVVSALAIACWYEWRYRAAIAMHRHFDRGLYK